MVDVTRCGQPIYPRDGNAVMQPICARGGRMTDQAVLPRSLTVLPEWSQHWCVTPGCQHMPAMGHDYCCCEDRGTKP